ncbi:MAG: electron transport complex subunit RsxC [Candidatus Cloacimonadia bacterium]
MKAKTFKGGVHPRGFPQNAGHEGKELSNKKEIEKFAAPQKVLIHLQQHIGSPAKPLVKRGDFVKKGQKIADATGFVSIPMHSPISGKVTNIDIYPHPAGSSGEAIEIENDGKDEWEDSLEDRTNYLNMDPKEMLSRIQSAGICGMGGAGFPTHVKLSPPPQKPIDTVILNGVECEPYLTADHRTMVEHSDSVIAGLQIIMKILGAPKGYIGIESNKPDAIKIMREKVKGVANISVVSLHVKYPQGAEKQLIYAVTRRKVPAGGLPMDVGVVVQNVGTAWAIYEAVRYNKPSIERVTTVTGPIVKNPKNILAPIGTLVSDLINFCEGTYEDISKLISGGPMMGFALTTQATPIIKGTSGIVIFGEASIFETKEHACIRCGGCVDVCPMQLAPTMIVDSVKNASHEEAKKLHITDCMECGSCAYVCPSHISLVQWIKLGKLEIAKLDRQ